MSAIRCTTLPMRSAASAGQRPSRRWWGSGPPHARRGRGGGDLAADLVEPHRHLLDAGSDRGQVPRGSKRALAVLAASRGCDGGRGVWSLDAGRTCYGGHGKVSEARRIQSRQNPANAGPWQLAAWHLWHGRRPAPRRELAGAAAALRRDMSLQGHRTDLVEALGAGTSCSSRPSASTPSVAVSWTTGRAMARAATIVSFRTPRPAAMHQTISNSLARV